MTIPTNDQREFIASLDQLVGARLRKARERMGLSQQVIAVKLAPYGIDWHQTTVGKVESGERPARLSELVALADVYGVPIDALVYGQDSSVQQRDRIMAAAGVWQRLRRLADDEIRQLGAEFRGEHGEHQ